MLKQVQFPEIEGNALASQNAIKVTSCIYKRIVKLNAAHTNLENIKLDGGKDTKSAKQHKEQLPLRRNLAVCVPEVR